MSPGIEYISHRDTVPHQNLATGAGSPECQRMDPAVWPAARESSHGILYGCNSGYLFHFIRGCGPKVTDDPNAFSSHEGRTH